MEAHRGSRQRRGIAGWATFAATLFFLAGAFNTVIGVTALAGDSRFAENELFFGELSLWGGLLLLFGALQIFIAALIYRRSPMGQVSGIMLAGLNLLAHLFFIGVYPVWSVIVMAVNAIVLYGLTVHGEDF